MKSFCFCIFRELNTLKLRTSSIVALLYLMLNCCTPLEQQDYSTRLYAELEVQGHRGCRGSLPENSIAGFLQALEWRVNTLEMDVVISKDHKVVLSHEPFISHQICLDRTGSEIDSATHFQYNIYEMTYQEIKEFDCGSKPPVGFIHQKPIPGPKPLLREVIQAVENKRIQLKLPPVKYNIETKILPGYDEIFHPGPAKFVELVLAVVKEKEITERTIIQSFDPRTLQQVRAQNPTITTALLIDNKQGPLFNFIQLGFEPSIYSPDHNLVTDSLVQYLHKKHIAVIPWTVNDLADMNKCIEMGVDGIITDYPEILLKQLGRLGKQP